MDVIDILKVFKQSGYEAYLIGGYPRDKYLNKKTSDYDVTTNASLTQIKTLFKDNIINENYSCVTVLYQHKKYEITPYRKDLKYINHRKPIIEYTDTLKDDLMRRDFTINTICIDEFGNYIDYLHGMDDIDNKIIKVVGDTKVKILEDALRILRAIRFATILNFKLSNELTSTIKMYGYLLKHLSYERKRQELDKIFSSQNINYGLNLIKDLDLEQYLEINTKLVKTNLIGIWAQINNFNYPFTKKEKKAILKIQQLVLKDILDNYNLYTYGLDISLIAGDIKGIPRTVINDKYNKLTIKKLSDIDINPVEICKILKKKPDKLLTIIISDLEKKIVNDKLLNDKNIIVKYLLETYL